MGSEGREHSSVWVPAISAPPQQVVQMSAEGMSDSLAMGMRQHLCLHRISQWFLGWDWGSFAPCCKHLIPFLVFSSCGLLPFALPCAQTKALHLEICCNEEPPGKPQVPLADSLTLQLYFQPACLWDSMWGSQPLPYALQDESLLSQAPYIFCIKGGIYCGDVLLFVTVIKNK